jgi:hypothetical protein
MVISLFAVCIVVASPCARHQRVTALLLFDGHLWRLHTESSESITSREGSTGFTMKKQIRINKPKCVTSSAADCRRSAMPMLLLTLVGLLWVSFAPATAQAQTLLSETT